MASDFGTVFMPEMAIAHYTSATAVQPAGPHAGGQQQAGWSETRIVPSDSLTLHPGSHVFHYASTCFEGLKAFRHDDGSVHVFRIDRNVARLAQSSRLLCMPAIDERQATAMIIDLVERFRDHVPAPPASMYIRPTHIGTEAAIGKAAAPSLASSLYVLLSPVGDYFAGGEASLRLLLDEQGARCGADHGMVKGGGNYASALKHILAAQQRCNADQVLFCPGGDVQETGAANFLLIENGELVTKPLDESFLHGVTRDSVLQLARERGLTVTERDLPAAELMERAASPEAEAGLSGTAAVLASVGTLIHGDREVAVGTGQPGPHIRAIRERLNAIQWGRADDVHGWLTRV